MQRRSMHLVISVKEGSNRNTKHYSQVYMYLIHVRAKKDKLSGLS
jgi:hypothetical protein